MLNLSSLAHPLSLSKNKSIVFPSEGTPHTIYITSHFVSNPSRQPTFWIEVSRVPGDTIERKFTSFGGAALAKSALCLSLSISLSLTLSFSLALSFSLSFFFSHNSLSLTVQDCYGSRGY